MWLAIDHRDLDTAQLSQLVHLQLELSEHECQSTHVAIRQFTVSFGSMHLRVSMRSIPRLITSVNTVFL
jgi:hypothetical protein